MRVVYAECMNDVCMVWFGPNDEGIPQVCDEAVQLKSAGIVYL